MAEEVFSSRMRLKVLRSMIPDYKRYLRPHKIISDLYILNEDQKREIVEREEQSRQEAVQMLMDIIVAKGDEGLSCFIFSLKQGDNNLERFLNPLEETPTNQSHNHPEVNEYFSMIIHCLEGDIKRLLTKAELDEVMRKLQSEGVIDEDDIDELQSLSHEQKIVHLFRMLPQATHEWPLKFFRALKCAKPELVRKCDPLGESPYEEVSKETAVFSSLSEEAEPVAVPSIHRALSVPDCEQTSPKRMRISSDEDNCGDVSMDVEELLLASDEDSFNDFSDEEEKEDAGTEKTAQPKILSMRQYQYELATPAIKGENTIICAPTGSGKTRVALYIVKEHLSSRDSKDLGNRKVLFLARTVPLVSQQFKIFEKYLPDFRCGKVHGETTDHDNLHLMLDDYDILVLTPKVLENHLAEKKIPSLSVFSLIIFDECHHTRKGEPYNSVMKNYLQFKKAGEKNLPQIVGLTASIGIEKASTVEAAQTSIIEIMANLDVNSITKVKEHLEELYMIVPIPDERLEELRPRADDKISKFIIQNMIQVEEFLRQQTQRHHQDPEFDYMGTILGKRPAERSSQKYGQWAVKVCDQARKVHIPEDPDQQHSAEMIERRKLFSQNVQLLAETLIAYNEAIDVHELTRPADVLEHLKRKLDPRHTAESPEPTEMEIVLLNLFQGLQRKLNNAASSKNPNLRKLSAVIEEQLRGQWDTSRVMIFVRTRATCQALCNWLNTDSVIPELQELKASPFTGTGAHQEHGGMTQHEQEGVIEKFRDGDVKLLVCTTVGQEGIDIQDCNLVIRYNHVGNEVATVQTRGRSRKACGVSVLLAMPEIIRKERINKKRVQIMNEAIDKVNMMRARELSNKVMKAQKLTMDKDEMKKIASMRNRNSRMKQGSFHLECARCRKVRLPGFRIRTVSNSHHVVIGNDLREKEEVSIKIKDKPKMVDNVQFTAEVICNKCPVMKQNMLGTVLKYQEAEFLTLKAEGWVVLDENNRVQKSGKWKWKDICYPIPELTPQDMCDHLGLPQDYEEDEEAAGAASD